MVKQKHLLEAIKAEQTFRPVLMALKIRAPNESRPVFFAEFDHLHLFELDNCSIEVLVRDLEECSGMFVSAYTKTGLFRNYIILNVNLFDKDKQEVREQLKITGVHEFCHFIALVYAACSFTIDVLKQRVLQRLNKQIDKLPKDKLIEIYTILSNEGARNGIQDEQFCDELTDKHFRLEVDCEAPDYILLFYQLLFSKDILDTDFNKDKQTEFKRLMQLGDKANVNTAASILIESIRYSIK